ncbi:MAG: lysylphosphatidylglycerol synthase transmembrane domain-containing protein, partial [Candidatus Firestonebacteria bacterium]
RAYRWGLIYRPGSVPSYGHRFSAILIGIMVNNVLPAKLGEVARAFVIGKKEGIGISRSFGTIILERVFDFVALIFTLIAIAIISPFERQTILASGNRSAFIITVAGFLAVIVALILLKCFTEVFVNSTKAITGVFSRTFAEKAGSALRSFAEGLKPLEDPKNGLKIIVVSVILWSIQGVMAYLVLLSFGINIGLFSSYFVIIIIILGCVIPPSPAGIGPTQFVAVYILSAYGVSPASALGFSLMYNFLGAILLTLLGWYYMVKESIKLSEILVDAKDKK